MIFSSLNFKLQQGEGLIITGPNGSGKSLLLRVLAGVIPPSSGKVFKDHHFSKQRHCDFDSRVDEFLSVSQYFTCWGNSNCRDEFVEKWNLGSIWKKRLEKLSLGERKRAQLATILSHNPTLLLLDEPDLGLDSDVSDLMTDLLARVPSTCTTVLASHHGSIYEKLSWESLPLGGGQ